MAMISAACATGPRPTLGSATTLAPLADSAIAAVVESLEGEFTTPFTVTYDITTKYGGLTSSGEVTFDPDRGTAVLIQNVLYVQPVEKSAGTCNWSIEDLAVRGCKSGIDESRVSALQLNSRVFKDAAADRMRRDAEVASATAQAREILIADRTALCADIPVIDGAGSQQTKSYCSFPDIRVLASLETADLSIVAVFVDDIATTSLFDAAEMLL